MKIDLKKTLPCYQARRGRFDLVDVPPLPYLMIDGHGDPNTAPEYAAAVETLYPLAYALKLASKRRLDRDYVVPPLEALWWADDMSVFTSARDKSAWNWTLMLLVPDWIEADLYASVLGEVTANAPPRIADLRLETLAEGSCVQTLHVGPYDDEGPVLAELHERVIPDPGLRMTGRHHEIYLSDPRRAAPEKLRTILRQPVEPIDRAGSEKRSTPPAA